MSAGTKLPSGGAPRLWRPMTEGLLIAAIIVAAFGDKPNPVQLAALAIAVGAAVALNWPSQNQKNLSDFAQTRRACWRQ